MVAAAWPSPWCVQEQGGGHTATIVPQGPLLNCTAEVFRSDALRPHMRALLAQPDLDPAEVSRRVHTLRLQVRDVACAIRQKRPVADTHVALAVGIGLEELAAAGVDDFRAQLVHRRRAVGAACTWRRHGG